MSRLMYDGINTDAVHIPTNARMVAGYVDGLYKWSAADWARFPNAIKIRIAVFGSTNDGHVLDCEKGNATPAQSVDWVLARRKAGLDPTVYCGRNTWWTAIRAAFKARGVPEPHYWVADYNGQPAAEQTIPAGAIGLQFQNTGIYDLSIMADYWPGIDPPQGADMPLTTADGDLVADRTENRSIGTIASPATAPATTTLGSEVASLPARFAEVNTKLADIGTKVADIDAKVGALTAPSIDPAAAAAAVKAALQDPTVLKLLAHAIAVELHNDTPSA